MAQNMYFGIRENSTGSGHRFSSNRALDETVGRKIIEGCQIYIQNFGFPKFQLFRSQGTLQKFGTILILILTNEEK